MSFADAFTSSASSSSTSPLPRHDFYQSDDRLTLSVYVKGLKPEDVSVAFRERSLKLTFPTASYDFSPFPHSIDPETSTYRVSPVKVEVVLVKREAGLQWNALTGSGEGDLGMPAPHSKEETTPAVARQKKNWAKLADEAIAGSNSAGKPAEDDAAVNDLFKQIYQDADDDTRRAMMKSFSESGGTTLSTNWKDIGSKKTPIQPPSGMEAKKWE